VARRALDLDPELAEARASLAFALMYGHWEWDEAGREFRQALELNTDYAVGHYWYAELLTATGQYDRALEHARKAVTLEPGLPIARHIYGVTLMRTRQFEEAAAQADRALALEPAFALPHFTKAMLALVRNDIDGWRAEISQVGASPRTADIVSQVLRGDLDTRHGARLLNEVIAESDRTPTPLGLGMAFALIGDLDRSLNEFEAAARQRNPGVIMVPTWTDLIPQLAPLGEHPRFSAFVRMLGLDE
jgi:tetratricopeptide (TPR) repeat protein